MPAYVHCEVLKTQEASNAKFLLLVINLVMTLEVCAKFQLTFLKLIYKYNINGFFICL